MLLTTVDRHQGERNCNGIQRHAKTDQQTNSNANKDTFCATYDNIDRTVSITDKGRVVVHHRMDKVGH